MTDADFKDLLGSQQLQLLDGEAPTEGVKKEKRRTQALEDKKSKRAVISVLAIEDVLELPSITVDVPGVPKPIVVCFDKITHGTGNRRCFVYCPLKHECVRRCRKYKFFQKDFNSNRETAARWFAAWVYKGTVADIPEGGSHAMSDELQPGDDEHAYVAENATIR